MRCCFDIPCAAYVKRRRVTGVGTLSSTGHTALDVTRGGAEELHRTFPSYLQTARLMWCTKRFMAVVDSLLRALKTCDPCGATAFDVTAERTAGTII